MSGHRGVSAAEKYAELEANGLERTRCACHGEPMLWTKRPDRPEGGQWRCVVVRRENDRAHYWTNPDAKRERNRRWRRDNPEKRAATDARRIRIGGTYLGMCGFTQTEVEAMLSGTSN